MRLLTLDLSTTTTGFAIGEVGFMPERSGSVKMRKYNAPVEDAFTNIVCLLRDQFFMFNPPNAIVVEDFISKMSHDGSNAKTILALAQLQGAVKGYAGSRGVNVIPVHGNTVKVHFIGAVSAAPRTRGRTNKQKEDARRETKAAIWRRCVQLRYFPADAPYDDDRSDACAIYSWASAVHFRAPAENFKLFGG